MVNNVVTLHFEKLLEKTKMKEKSFRKKVHVIISCFCSEVNAVPHEITFFQSHS